MTAIVVTKWRFIIIETGSQSTKSLWYDETFILNKAFFVKYVCLGLGSVKLSQHFFD